MNQKHLSRVAKDLKGSVHGNWAAKDAVLELIAQRMANGASKGECIALEGPRGVGKATFACHGIAKALGRPFAKISINECSDPSILVGRDLADVDACWGRIVEILYKAQCMDPVIYIEGIDTVPRTKKGRKLMGILAALINFSKNHQFKDRYFSGLKFDLSRAWFIFSCHHSEMLDPIFRDHLKVISMEPLVLRDKVAVVRRYLLEEALNNCGFNEGEILIHDEEIRFLIEQYTLEAGVHALKKHLQAIIRGINKQRLMEPGSIQFPYHIDKEAIIYSRGEPTIEFRKMMQEQAVGMVNGLYANPLGVGGVTLVQVGRTLSNERLGLTLTGNLGGVMRESMIVARSVAWNLIPQNVRQQMMQGPVEGLHIHTPEGWVPKDGPSIGAAITTAIVSLLTGMPVRNEVAITGEIDLKERVLKVGGLLAKLEGAKREGVRLVLCPKDNEKELREVMRKLPELIDDSFAVIMVDTIHDILDEALVWNPIPRPAVLQEPYKDPILEGCAAQEAILDESDHLSRLIGLSGYQRGSHRSW